MLLMNDLGAAMVKLMAESLNDPVIDLTEESRVRTALNTFLHFFVAKYAHEYAFSNCDDFGDPIQRCNSGSIF